mmetsp:Transcript_23065/g.66036  ORF Transcript_23065/g.66036 Transcript_23065/m.66036 type:complete len:82 (+) Transcript_23065:152-397(+)
MHEMAGQYQPPSQPSPHDHPDRPSRTAASQPFMEPHKSAKSVCTPHPPVSMNRHECIDEDTPAPDTPLINTRRNKEFWEAE